MARIPLLFGTAFIGRANTNTGRIHDLADCQRLLDVYTLDYKYQEIDCARMYASGSSEEYLSKLNLHGASVDTKCFPFQLGDHSPAKLRESLETSIKALGSHKVRIFYLHAPDRGTPFEETAEGINDLYQEGLFEKFGLSNYASWEVAEIYTICKERGYVLPTVYQGPYNIISRNNEDELFPALRKYNIRFVAFNALAGGLLTGRLQSKDAAVEPGSRYDEKIPSGARYRKRYTEGKQFEAVELLKEAGAKHGLSLGDIAFGWLQHHSALTPEDGIILGASKVEQLKESCLISEKGPLPDEVVATCEKAWLLVKPSALLYTL